MPIREESFRIGCGRYIQGAGYISRCADEVLRLGTAPMIVGDDTTLGITREKIEKSVSGVCNKYEIIVHNGTCNEERAKELAELAIKQGYDVVVGVGGGVLMDFAKLCGFFAKLPVINIPTSSATCAAYASLSVRYTPDGRTVGSLHYDHEVNAVIADTEIIAAQPVRLLLAGVFDALAKFVEIKQRYSGDISEECPMGLDYAYAMAKHSYELLNKKTAACIEAMERGEVTDDVESVIFTTIAATGVISGIARGSNQCALAHKFYETTRFLFNESARPYLHGEIVGVGLLLQNHFNGEAENNGTLLELMKKHNMPHTITDVGIDASEETFNEFYSRICASSAVDDENEEECRRFKESLRYLWEIK
ncbi:MAG: iron-containing alcohol dehydrogenase [Clostridia bacterium]|nr:iron-containing alcohol dehydrogenase [Clostridia bacterium]